ncbi:zinc finger protein VAR3, chloroplastic-like [Cynara cardunculus var. scolymus]|uniref:zinc finger protein VAR3, chloroplastic-like n=1 Tax=Cynara cardunculus var. scolymus TaxID=59895 RepID=UPI000D6306FA|nr:zinc finger protein VAR3, chloroplastic-like [Cynara cardunculus var. scolymus]
MVGASSRLLSLLSNPTYLLRHRSFALFRLARCRSLTFPLTTLSAAADRRFHLSRHTSLIPIKLTQNFCSRPTYNAFQENNQIPANDHHAQPSHPWVEWNRLLEFLSVEGYFNGRNNVENEFAANENLSMEFVAVANSCLAFARDKPDILGLLPRKDIEVLIDDGYPFLFKNAHETERRMRSFLQVEGSNEASSVDLMKYILSYASNPIIYPERYIKEATESSVRSLVQEITNLSYRGPYAKQFQAVGRGEQMPRILGPNITMKRGDWICLKCNFMNFARNTKCLECEELRPQRQLTDGEWDCPQCNFFNYRRNTVCLKCECRRPGEVSLPGSPWQAKTPSERQQTDSHYRYNYDDNGIPNDGNNFTVRNKNLEHSVNRNPDRFLGNTSTGDSGTYSNNIDRGQNGRKDGYVPFVPLPDMSPKNPEKITDEHSEEQCSEKSTTYVQSRHISDVDKEEKSERWFKKVKELHGVTGPTSDFPQIMPTRNGENRFVDRTKKDRPFSPYRKQQAMEQGNASSYVPFVPFPPDYFAKKDNQQQPKSPDSTVKPADDISSGHSHVSSAISSGHSHVSSAISSGHSDVNSAISSGHSQGNQHMSSTNKLDLNAHSSSSQFTRKETVNIGQKTPENESGWTGKSLEGSAVTESDPLDMSEEAKAERWFRRVAQIKDISELSQIPDEDFPSIMPMRKGVNRFVVSKRKTPLERRLTSPQYRKNLRIMSSDPIKREGDDDT